MNFIDILMPIEEGRYIPKRVLEGILCQDIQFRLWTSTKFSEGDYAGARNNIKKYTKTDFALMLDNDIVLPKGAIVKMIDFLLNHPNYAAIGLPKHPLSDFEKEDCLHAQHVDMSCVLFRKEILDKITFLNPQKQNNWHPSGGMCECAVCCWDIRQMGFEIGFLPGLQVEHIGNTKR